jgi:hypothetical protein
MRYRNVVVQFSHPPHSPLVSAGAAPHALLRAVTSASLEKGGVVAGGARPSRLLVLVASSGVGAATSVQDDAVEHRHRHLNPTMQTLALVRRSSPFFTLKLRLKFRTSAAALDSSRRNVL